MQIKLSVFFLVLISFCAFAIDKSEKIISVINEELRELERLSTKQSERNPETLFRIAELYLEKARIVRDNENQKYLKLSEQTRRASKKSDYFKTSQSLYEKANNEASKVVKKFPSYKLIGEVYFVLGSNFKELGKSKSAKKYFELALSKSPVNSKTHDQSMLVLADYAYNDKEFSKSIKFYESSLQTNKSKWWTRDAFNLAWSYFRIRNYDKAISTMLKVHELSKSKEYVDFSSLAERDIGLFYIDAKRIDEAIRFYQKNKIDYSSQFLRISENLISQGKFAQAEKLLDEVYKKEKKREAKISLLLSQLMLFDKFNKLDSHFEAAQILVGFHENEKFNSDDLKKLNFQLDKKSAELQKQVSSETYKNVPKVRYSKANYANNYFDLSARVNPDKKSEKFFYKAETWFSFGDFEKSLRFYIESFDSSVNSKETLWKKRSLEGMLASLGKLGSKKSSDSYLIPVYTRYLSEDGTSQRAKDIHIRLFNAYYSKGDIRKSEDVMTKFAKRFSSDVLSLEGMIAKIMEYYRQKKDYSILLSYIKRIDNKEFLVTPKYENALKSLVTKIQIEEVQKSLARGNKSEALKGYHKIYDQKDSTSKARANAAYNLAVLYHELGDAKETEKWSSIALNLMATSDIKSLASSFVGISSTLFLRHEFERSSNLSISLFEKLCLENNKNKEISFKNAIFIELSKGNIDKSLEIRKTGEKCHVPDEVLRDVSLEILKDLSQENRWESYEEILGFLAKNQKNYSILIGPYELLKVQYERLGNIDKAREIDNLQNKFFITSKNQNVKIPLETLDLIASKLIKNISNKMNQLISYKFEFPEAKFNSLVKNKLATLDSMASDVEKVKSLGSGIGLVQAYSHLFESYRLVAQELDSFTPPGKGEDYLKSFRSAMRSVSGPLFQTANKLNVDIKALIQKNKILSDLNSEILISDKFSKSGHFVGLEFVPMERKGKR